MGFSAPTPAALTYLSATQLYVNSGSGNDNGAGTIADPLQSLEQALKNVHARRLNGNEEQMTIYLSGNTGDADVHSQVRYYWPNGYLTLMGYLDIYGWDGTSTTEDPTPAALYTGSSVVYSNSYTTDMSHWGGGLLCTLYTDSGFSTPVNYGAAGSQGPLSEGYFLGIQPLTPGTNAVRPIAHVITGGVANTIRIADGRPETPYQADPWTTATKGDMQVFKWGAVVDFAYLQTPSAKSQAAAVKQFWRYLEVTSSWTGGNNIGGFGFWTGRSEWTNCTIKYDLNFNTGGTGKFRHCYYAPNDQSSPTNLGGYIAVDGAVLDMGKTWAGEAAGDFLAINNTWTTDGYNIIQNVSSSTRGLVFGVAAVLSSTGLITNCTWHITNSAGFYGGAVGLGAAEGASIRTGGQPIQLLGQTNNTGDGGTYILRMPSGSAWNWHTGSMVMQEDGVTECLVSVDNGATQGSADIKSNSFIFNYTSSIDRNSSDASNYPTFDNDYSASLAVVEENANI